jgi:hypothetical protein
VGEVAAMKPERTSVRRKYDPSSAPPPVTQPFSIPSHTAIRLFADFRHSPTLRGQVLSYLNQTGLL